MIQYDFYSGEPISGSPTYNDISTNMSNVEVIDTSQYYQNENQFAQPQQFQPQYIQQPPTLFNNGYMAQPQQFQPQYIQQQPMYQTYQPGSYGYNSYGYDMNQPQNMYSMPQQNMYNMPQQNMFNMPQQNTGFSGYAGNPAFDMINKNPQLMYNQAYQQTYEDKVVHVPGFNPGSSMLLPVDVEEVCSKLQMDMLMEQEEAIARRNQRFQGYFNNNYGAYNNYYGMPYISQNYMDHSVSMKYKNMIEDMKQQAIERRNNLNKRLSRMVHDYLGDGVTEEDIDRTYDGYTYTVPGTQLQNYSHQDRLASMVPVSNCDMYRNHYNEIRSQYNAIVNPNGDMNEFLNDLGMLQCYYNLEQEYHNRRNGAQHFEQDSYRRFLRKAINQRLNQQEPQQPPVASVPFGQMFPTLSNSSTIMEDGSLVITPPPWLGKSRPQQTEIVTNELEQHFEENRHRFLQSIYNANKGGQ